MGGLHGRGMELSELDGHRAAVTEHAGRAVTLIGAAGIGKTALLGAAVERARDAGFRILRARGSEAEQGVPYGVVGQLLGPVARDAASCLTGGAVRGRTFILGEVEGELDEVGIARDLCWMVDDVAAAGPLSLVVDDLHWVDDPSLRVLDLLRTRIEDLGVLLLTATRHLPEGGWGADASMHLVAIGPLDQPAVDAIVRDALGETPSGLTTACREVTGGNPFLLREVVRTLQVVGAGAAVDAAAVRALVPEAIVRSTAARLAAMSQDTVRLANAAALLGDDFDLGRAGAVADLAPAAAAVAADTLVRESIFSPTRPLRFAHPLLLAAVRDAIPGPERSALQARAARLLHTEPGGLDLACVHLLEVDPAGNPEVVDVLLRGAAGAMAHGVADVAVTYLRRALAEPPADPREESVVLLSLAQAAYSAQEPDAHELAMVALDRATEPEIVVAATLNAGHLITLAGQPEKAIELVHGVLRRHELPQPLVEACEALALGWSLASTVAHAGSDDVVARARTRSRAADAPRTMRGVPALEAAFAEGDAAQTIELARSAWDEGDLLREVGPASPLSGYVIAAAIIAGDMAVADRWADRCLEMSAAIGSVTGRAASVTWRAWVREAGADPTAAAAYGAEALDIHERSQAMGMLLPIPVAVMGHCALATDGAGRATDVLDRLPVAARDPRYLTSPIWWLARATVALEAGRAEDALADVGEVAAWQRAWPAPLGGWTLWEPLAVEAHLALGDEDLALALAEAGLERARAWGGHRPLARALRASALTLPAKERLPLLEQAVTLTERGWCGLDGPRYRIDVAESHLARGDVDPALERLQEAFDLASRSGADAVASRAAAVLATQGLRPKRYTGGHGIHTLSPAERRAVDLAAQDRTNREIAETLFVTVKTVETHLASAFRKLEVRSRSQLRSALITDSAGSSDNR